MMIVAVQKNYHHLKHITYEFNYSVFDFEDILAWWNLSINGKIIIHDHLKCNYKIHSLGNKILIDVTLINRDIYPIINTKIQVNIASNKYIHKNIFIVSKNLNYF